MKMASFRTLIREEIKKALNEDAAAASRYADLLKQRVQIEKEIQLKLIPKEQSLF